MKEAIANTLRGDYESVILSGASAVTSKSGEMAQAFTKALKQRMSNGQGGDGAQHHRDSHGPATGQNNGSEREQRNDWTKQKDRAGNNP